jgi:hypothetical protein
MSRKRFVYFFLAVAVVLSSLLIFAQEAPDQEAPHGETPDHEALDEILLDKVKDKLPAVLFPHKRHVDENLDMECGKCHHKKPEEPASCYSCHKEKKEEETPSARDGFHKLCVTCHKEKKNETITPPIKCVKCHKKPPPE